MATREELRQELTFEQTVPCALAHRRALGEVFVADSAALDDDEFLLAIQVPRAHSLWFDRRVPYHDPFSTAEAARQSAFVVVHRHLEVPQGLPFSLERFEFRVENLGAYRDDESSPLEGVLRMKVVDDRRRGEVGTLAFEGDLAIAETRAMSMRGRIVFLPKRDYESLREFQRSKKSLNGSERPEPPERLDPAAVGRVDARNVVIGEPSGDRFPIVIDQTHPSFFDHAYDHVPGPLVVEAWRQAAIITATRAEAVPSPVVAATACEAAFSDFAEFEAEITCSATLGEAVSEEGPLSVDVGLHQLGNQIAEGRIELTRWP